MGGEWVDADSGDTGLAGKGIALLAGTLHDVPTPFTAIGSLRVADGRVVEEATSEALSAGDLDLCLFSVGTRASRELVPHAVRGGAVCIDKSAAFRLEPGIPLVVPEVNGDRALEHKGVLANPNCCAIPLALVLAPLHEAAGLRAVRVATYQSASGAGAQRLQRLLDEPQAEHDLAMDWDYDGEEFEEESKLRDETRKILELPDLPLSAPTFAATVQAYTDAPVVGGNRVDLLLNGDQISVSYSSAGAAATLAEAEGGAERGHVGAAGEVQRRRRRCL